MDESGTTIDEVMSSSIWSFAEGEKSFLRLKIRHEPSDVYPTRRYEVRTAALLYFRTLPNVPFIVSTENLSCQ